MRDKLTLTEFNSLTAAKPMVKNNKKCGDKVHTGRVQIIYSLVQQSRLAAKNAIRRRLGVAWQWPCAVFWAELLLLAFNRRPSYNRSGERV